MSPAEPASSAASAGRPCDELLDERLSGRVAVDSAISPAFATALTRIVAELAPRTALEIGMAHGVSSLAILAGLPPGGRLISLDPFQDVDWGGAGRRAVAASNRADRHELRQSPDYLELPRMLAAGETVDFAYIDGMHTFDYVLVDAFYVDKLLPIGGVVGFNDCGFRSIHRALRFFTGHRRYEEIDVGLPADFGERNVLARAWRRLEGRSNQDRYFRKLDAWEPPHNFYRRF